MQKKARIIRVVLIANGPWFYYFCFSRSRSGHWSNAMQWTGPGEIDPLVFFRHLIFSLSKSAFIVIRVQKFSKDNGQWRTTGKERGVMPSYWAPSHLYESRKEIESEGMREKERERGGTWNVITSPLPRLGVSNGHLWCCRFITDPTAWFVIPSWCANSPHLSFTFILHTRTLFLTIQLYDHDGQKKKKANNSIRPLRTATKDKIDGTIDE